jgi:flagellar protein FliO/FliZ
MARPFRHLPAATTAAWLLLGSAIARAAKPESTPLDLSEEVERTQSQATGSGSLVRTVLGLVVVVGTIYGLYWLLGKVKASREEGASGAGLSSLATLPLGTGRSLHLVRVGREVVVVGVGEHGVRPVRSYSEQAALQAGLIDPEEDDDEVIVTRLGAPDAGPTAPATVRGAVEALRVRTVRR